MKAYSHFSSDDFPGKRGAVAFFDFDNTLTEFDVLDSIIKRFAVNTSWIELEEAWQAGKIGSKECLEGQLKSVRANREILSQYLSTVKLDPHFKELLQVLNRKGVNSLIVSDSFTFLIHTILNAHGIDGIPVYANELSFQGDQLIPSFPFFSPDCLRCAHCKKRHVLKEKDKVTVYVGDGLSDICPAEHANIVFAKGKLLEHFSKLGRSCVPFESLLEVQSFFNRREVFSS